MTKQPAILQLFDDKPTEELTEVDNSPQDLEALKLKLGKLKESKQKTQQAIREVLTQLSDLEELERRTLELLLSKLEKA